MPQSAALHPNLSVFMVEHMPQLSCWHSPSLAGKLGRKGAVLGSGVGRGSDGLVNGLLALSLSRAPFPSVSRGTWSPGQTRRLSSPPLALQAAAFHFCQAHFHSHFSWLPDFVVFAFLLLWVFCLYFSLSTFGRDFTGNSEELTGLSCQL